MLDSTDSLDTVVARNQFIRGVHLAKQERWSEAYLPLKDAWKHKQHWQIAFNLGRVEFEIGKYRDAAEHFELVLRAPELARPAEGPDPLAGDRSLATVWLARARSRMGYIIVNTFPGALVSLDGKVAGKAPLSGRLGADPGTHTLEVKLGGTTRHKNVTLESGQEITVTLKGISRLPDASPTAASPPPDPPPTPPSARSVLLGASLALTLTGVVVGGIALSLASDYGKQASQRKQGPAGSFPRAEAEHKSLALWSFLGAGLAGGVGLTYFLATTGAPEQVQAPPVAGLHGGGILFQGRF